MERDPRPEKVATVTDIRDRLEDSRAVFVTEYRGLSVSEQQRLRRALRDAAAEYKIYKMTLARRAATEAGFEDLLDMLNGPTGLAFVSDDPVMAAKAMKEIADEIEAFTLKGGLLAGSIVDPDGIKSLAEMEPREVQIAKMAGLLVASLQNMVGVMNSMLAGFANMMTQLAEKKESGEVPGGDSSAAAADEAPDADAAGDDADTDEAEEASDESTDDGDAADGAAEKTEEASAEDAGDDESDDAGAEGEESDGGETEDQETEEDQEEEK